jgi:predicted metalloprotease with PDZ domain
VLVHELTHLAFPSVPARHHWIEEGLASYVEPVARAQAGQLDPRTVWAELAAGLPQGLPRAGDRGLDHTPTWGRIYWGGALFALLSDVEIRRQTQNRLGLQDALRGILGAGNIELASPLESLLEIGDRATGTRVLGTLYTRMKDHGAPVELDALWGALGVQPEGRTVRFDDAAPLAATRQAITAPPPAPADRKGRP